MTPQYFADVAPERLGERPHFLFRWLGRCHFIVKLTKHSLHLLDGAFGPIEDDAEVAQSQIHRIKRIGRRDFGDLRIRLEGGFIHD